MSDNPPFPIRKNPFSDPLARYIRIEEMVKHINQLKKKDMHKLTDAQKIPLPARQSLIVFVRDWQIDDPTHTRFIEHTPKGFPAEEALRMGDLLAFVILGGEERRKWNKSDRVEPWTRWQDYLQPFLKNKPDGVQLQDLIGLQVELLNMLPQHSYNQYTIAQMFAEDPTMKDQLLGERVQLSPLEFESLTMLTRIVETGAIEQFKLAMARGSKKGLQRMSQKRKTDLGALMMDAFRMAQKAVNAFVQGDFGNALDWMHKLQANYGIGTNSFAAGMDQMFLATMSARDGEKNVKGSNKPILMSLDTTFAPIGGYSGGATAASNRARVVASTTALDCEADFAKFKRGTPAMQTIAGTNGLRTGVSQVGKNSKTLAPLISTDWLPIFAAVLHDFGDDGTVKKFNPAMMATTPFLNSVFKKVSGTLQRPILRFVIHGYMEEGLKDLMPKGLLTVALTPPPVENLTAALNTASKPKWHKYTVDLIYEDFDEISRTQNRGIPTYHTELATTGDGDDPSVERLWEQMDQAESMGIEARRKASKKASKKRPTFGQMIAIELTPSTQVRLSTAEDNAEYYKRIMRNDDDLKWLWKKYAKGNKPIYIRSGPNRGKYEWHGKLYEDKASAKKAIDKEGTYADYKGGKANMRMVYAKRKDNGNEVPFRLYLPKILVRQQGDRLIPKSGAKKTKQRVQKLLDILEKDFGPLKFKIKPLAKGGYDRYPARKSKDPVTRVDRGVAKIFQAQGLDTGDQYSTKAHPSQVRPSGTILYMAMTKGGQAVEMEVR
jgi:hypothetical protein